MSQTPNRTVDEGAFAESDSGICVTDGEEIMNEVLGEGSSECRKTQSQIGKEEQAHMTPQQQSSEYEAEQAAQAEAAKENIPVQETSTSSRSGHVIDNVKVRHCSFAHNGNSSFAHNGDSHEVGSDHTITNIEVNDFSIAHNGNTGEAAAFGRHLIRGVDVLHDSIVLNGNAADPHAFFDKAIAMVNGLRQLKQNKGQARK